MLTDILIMALATATVSVTVGQSKLFAPLRAWVKEHWDLGGELISCPYCLGHWVALGVGPVYWSGPVDVATVTTVWLATVALAALISGTIGRLYGE